MLSFQHKSKSVSLFLFRKNLKHSLVSASEMSGLENLFDIYNTYLNIWTILSLHLGLCEFLINKLVLRLMNNEYS